MAAQLLPNIEEFVWGSREITEDGLVVMENNSIGGYRCPICEENFQTKREDTFKKHFNPKRKGATDTAKHKQVKEGIPKIKERCAKCNTPGDPNPGKKRKHLAVCKENLDDTDQNENIVQEKVKDESIEIDDEEYENIFMNVNPVEEMETEVDVSEVENLSKESFGEIEVEQHKEGEEIDLGHEEISQLKEYEVKQNKEISVLKKLLEVSENKRKEEEIKTKELVDKFNTFMTIKDDQLKELEQSVTTLEDERLEQIGVLEEKLKIATELYEHRKDSRDLESKIVDQQNELETEGKIKKVLQTKLLQFEQKLKETDEEKMRIRKEMLDSKGEVEKVIKQMNKLETEVLDMSNQTEDLEREISKLKTEKTERIVKIDKLEDKMRETVEEGATKGKLMDQLKANLDQMKRDIKDVTHQNSNLNKEKDSLKKEKDLLGSKLQKCKDQVEAMSKLPMIKSIKIDKTEGETAVGKGTFGTIIKVKENGRHIAVKKSEINSDSISEALAMSKFNHPHVVSALGVSIENDQLLISMELYDEDLSIFLGKMEKIKDEKAGWRLKVFKDTARGLKYLHKLQFIHRDLKPQNILLKHTGDSISASLADFGMVHFGLQGSQWCGTSGFIAPEMYTDGGVPTYSELVDEWSLGACMYELIFGDCLVKSEDYEEQANPKPKWEKVKVKIPSFITALKGLLVIEPGRRKSAQEILRIL